MTGCDHLCCISSDRNGELWDTATTAARLGLSETWVRQLVANGSFPTVRGAGGRVRFRPQDVDAWGALCGRNLRPLPPSGSRTAGAEDRLAVVYDLTRYRRTRQYRP